MAIYVLFQKVNFNYDSDGKILDISGGIGIFPVRDAGSNKQSTLGPH